MFDSHPPAVRAPVALFNPHGRGPLLLVCEHASNFIPPEYSGLGLAATDRERHIAWDPGALELARQLATRLDVPLVEATHSRLLLDLNRDPQAQDSIVLRSEGTPVPGNQDLSAQERLHRRSWLYHPFHAAIDTLIDQRLQAGLATAVLSLHSFTPRYFEQDRQWHAGVIWQHDARLASGLLAALRAEDTLCIGANEPYGPHDGVYHSMGRHGEARGLPCAMLEIRNDQLLDATGQAAWVARLARCIEAALAGLGQPAMAAPPAALAAAGPVAAGD